MLAANIQDVILEGDLENPVAEFAERLVKLGVPERFREAWIQMADIALTG